MLLHVSFKIYIKHLSISECKKKREYRITWFFYNFRKVDKSLRTSRVLLWGSVSL